MEKGATLFLFLILPNEQIFNSLSRADLAINLWESNN